MYPHENNPKIEKNERKAYVKPAIEQISLQLGDTILGLGCKTTSNQTSNWNGATDCALGGCNQFNGS
jgi:hypothetical protein